MTDDLEQLLRNLHLKKIAEIVDDADGARPAGSSCRTATSWRGCSARSITIGRRARSTWRIKHAGLPEQWTLESFPFKRQPGVSAKQIRAFRRTRLPRARPRTSSSSGRRASARRDSASGLLLKAIQNGHRGRFVRAQDLFDEMYASLADRSTRKLLNTLIRIDVFVIDELGFVNLKPEQTNIFFKLMEERYRRRPTLDHDEPRVPRLAQLPRQQGPGRRAPQSPAPSVPHRPHRRPVAPRTARLTGSPAVPVDADGPVDAQTRPPVLGSPQTVFHKRPPSFLIPPQRTDHGSRVGGVIAFTRDPRSGSRSHTVLEEWDDSREQTWSLSR